MDQIKKYKRKTPVQKISAYSIPGLIKETVDLDHVLNIICNYYGFTKEEVLAKSRKVQLVYIRHLFMYWAMKELDIRLMDVSKFLGFKEHTVIIHSVKTFQDHLDTDTNIRWMVKGTHSVKQDYLILQKQLESCL